MSQNQPIIWLAEGEQGEQLTTGKGGGGASEERGLAAGGVGDVYVCTQTHKHKLTCYNSGNTPNPLTP